MLCCIQVSVLGFGQVWTSARLLEGRRVGNRHQDLSGDLYGVQYTSHRTLLVFNLIQAESDLNELQGPPQGLAVTKEPFGTFRGVTYGICQDLPRPGESVLILTRPHELDKALQDELCVCWYTLNRDVSTNGAW